jgi:hypothetical protein
LGQRVTSLIVAALVFVAATVVELAALMPHTAANPPTGSDGEPPQQERNSSGYRFGLAVRSAVQTVVDHWCPCPLVNRAVATPGEVGAEHGRNMGGIWEEYGRIVVT